MFLRMNGITGLAAALLLSSGTLTQAQKKEPVIQLEIKPGKAVQPAEVGPKNPMKVIPDAGSQSVNPNSADSGSEPVRPKSDKPDPGPQPVKPKPESTDSGSKPVKPVPDSTVPGSQPVQPKPGELHLEMEPGNSQTAPPRVIPGQPYPQPVYPRENNDGWSIQIIPRFGTGYRGGSPAGKGANCSPNVNDYQRIYASIPFSRAEFEANPSYRHDATMEILFGKLRPTTIVRGPASTGSSFYNPIKSPPITNSGRTFYNFGRNRFYRSYGRPGYFNLYPRQRYSPGGYSY